jgi:hypothetical protein
VATKTTKQTTSTGICQMDSKNINNNNNKQPQLGRVKWVAKTLTTTATNNLNWDV